MTRLFSQWFLASVCLLLPALAVANPLQLSLSPGVSAGHVTVELTNNSQSAVSVLRWNTPFESTLSEDVFQVTPSAKAVPFTGSNRYVGRHVKRGSPSPENYLILQPGETKTTSVHLSTYYDIEQLDNYRVRFVGEIQHTPAELKKNRNSKSTDQSVNPDTRQQQLISNEVSVALSPPLTSRILPPTYNSCSTAQQSYIQSATQSAELLTNNAISDLQGLAVGERATSPRYTTWFGSYTEQRFNRVVANFGGISDALAEEVIRYDCTCNEQGVYAYVFPIRPYDVFLCPEFHAADELGLNSRAGTIIHELSHFNVVAGTDDHAYQPSDTQSLAINDPARAIDNADNYEYFAENTPDIPIRAIGGSQPTTQFTPVSINSVVTGTVVEDSSDFFQVSGADTVTLRSNSGDSDLYVYADPQLNQLVCESENAVNVDQCDLDSSGTLYVEVFGYSSSEYSMEVVGQETVEPVVETVITNLGVLAANQPTSGTIESQTFHAYAAGNARVIELTTLSGDADLLVYDGPAEDGGVLICVSEEYTIDSAIDRCDVSDSDSTTKEVLVFGFEASTYSLVGEAPEDDGGNTTIPTPTVNPELPIAPELPIEPEPPVINPEMPDALVSLTGGSSGGSLGFHALFAGLVMVWCKRRRKYRL